MTQAFSRPFDLSFQDQDHKRRARHGSIWTEDDYTRLDSLVSVNSCLSYMCDVLQRSAAGVVPKLRQRGYLDENNVLHYPSRGDDIRHITLAQLTGEEIMDNEVKRANVPVIETRVLIRGTNAASLSDDQIFALIAELETKIASLQSIKAKSSKLLTHINALQADVNKLVEFVDAR